MLAMKPQVKFYIDMQIIIYCSCLQDFVSLGTSIHIDIPSHEKILLLVRNQHLKAIHAVQWHIRPNPAYNKQQIEIFEKDSCSMRANAKSDPNVTN